jgi:hypothetical protein
MMKENDIGDVIVLDGPTMCGIVTDRDIVVRAIADGKDPGRGELGRLWKRLSSTNTTRAGSWRCSGRNVPIAS